MKTFKSIIILFLIFIINLNTYNFCYAEKMKVLFIGNSFTHMNNFTEMVSTLADYTMDTIITDKSAFDSYTLEKHSSNEETINKIKLGCWNYVVLQEQSQRPVMDSTTFYNRTLFYAKYLDSLIHSYNPDARTLLFMTWGRKFGDNSLCKQYPLCCTYSGMQDLLIKRYNLLGCKLAVPVIPCGIAWKYFQEEHYINLYYADNKHPNVTGSYLNACMFYSTLLKKSPEGIKYNPANISDDELYLIQHRAYITSRLFLPCLFTEDCSFPD